MAAAVFGVAAAACAGEKLRCFAGIPPVADLVARVGGDAIRVHTLVPAGENPHTYSPSPRAMTRLARSRIYFATGMPFENRIVDKIRGVSGDLEVVWLDKGIDKRRMGASHSRRHDHAEEGAAHGDGDDRHHHEPSRPDAGEARHGEQEGMDPHIWMSPLNASIMAETIASALVEEVPDKKTEVRRNLADVQKQLTTVHDEIRSLLAPFEDETFYVFHPAFGYFGDAYGLRQQAVEVSGRKPTPKELRRLIQEARGDDVRILFVQPQFDSSSARAIGRAIDGTVVRLNSLEKDLIANFRRIAEKIRESLGND